MNTDNDEVWQPPFVGTSDDGAWKPPFDEEGFSLFPEPEVVPDAADAAIAAGASATEELAAATRFVTDGQFVTAGQAEANYAEPLAFAPAALSTGESLAQPEVVAQQIASDVGATVAAVAATATTATAATAAATAAVTSYQQNLSQVIQILGNNQAAKYADIIAATIERIAGTSKLDKENYEALVFRIADAVSGLGTQQKLEPGKIVDALLMIATANDADLSAYEQGNYVDQIKKYAQLIRRLRS